MIRLHRDRAIIIGNILTPALGATLQIMGHNLTEYGRIRVWYSALIKRRFQLEMVLYKKDMRWKRLTNNSLKNIRKMDS